MTGPRGGSGGRKHGRRARGVDDCVDAGEFPTDSAKNIFDQSWRSLGQAKKVLAEQVLCIRDLSQALQNTDAKRVAADREKSVFLSHMCHELRTPLTPILGMAEAMKMQIHGPIGDDKYLSYLDDIMVSGRLLLRHLDCLLYLSRVDFIESDVVKRRLKVSEVVHDSLSLVIDQAKTKNVRIQSHRTKNLPDILADQHMLQQLLSALVENAISMSVENTVINISSDRRDSDHVAISVHCPHYWMSDEDLMSAGGSYGNIDPEVSNRYRSIGLGFDVTNKLLELQGGKLEIDNETESGTTVTALLPSFPRDASPERLA